MNDGEGRRFNSGDDHDWIRAAAVASLNELAAWAGTLRAVCRRPSRIGRQWGSGEAATLNPLAFLATSAALLGLVVQGCYALVGDSGSQSVLADVLHWLQPYALFALFGLLAHLPLRRKRARSSVAMALYAGAGPATVCGFIGVLVATAVRLLAHDPTGNLIEGPSAVSPSLQQLLNVLTWAVLVWFWLSLTAALAGLHGVRYWRSALAVLSAQVALSLALGLVLRHRLADAGSPFLPTLLLGFTRQGSGHWAAFYALTY
jgi:hypothetical protein